MGIIFRVLFLGSVILTGLSSGVVAILFLYFSKNLPNIVTIEDYKPATVTKIYALGADKKPEVIAEFFKERRYVVPYEGIPKHVINAFISAEDDQFFNHQGVNVASIIRAAIANLKAGHVVQGGSTITQQVAKSLLLTSERSFVRKIKELILSNRMESSLSKQQILYLYLNQIYLGHGAYGVEAAARAYFNKNVSELSIAEAALIGGMPQAPGKYSPHLNPKKAKERQLYVLRRMFENRHISQNEMSSAAAENLRIYERPNQEAKFAQYYVEQVRLYLIEKYGEKKVYEDGLSVYLPVRITDVIASRNAIQDGLRIMDKRLGYRPIETAVKVSSSEMSKDKEKLSIDAIKEFLGYTVFTSDGRLDLKQSTSFLPKEIQGEWIPKGSRIPAIVTGLDERTKKLIVYTGLGEGTLSIENLKWAFSGTPEKQIRLGSKFKVGSKILVSIENYSNGKPIFGLQQEPVVQAALYSIDVNTGVVLAMEGGYSAKGSEFNRALQAKRQPGSAFKPIIFAAGVERGYTPGTIIVDSPIVYDDSELGKWKPANYEEKFYGDTTFRQALIKSRNIPTIKLLADIEIKSMIDFINRIGLTGDFPSDLSMSLGSGGVSLGQLVNAYTIFPRYGKKIKPINLLKVVDSEGVILEENKIEKLKPFDANTLVASQTTEASTNSLLSTLSTYPLERDPDQVLDPRVSYVMNHLMGDVVNEGTGYEAKSLGRKVAAKTGTTNDYQDAWFIGYTPSVATGVWVGYDTLKSLGHGETGARAALPIWLQYMKEVVKEYPVEDFAVPAGITFATIDAKTGQPVSKQSLNAIEEAFIIGTEPGSPHFGSTQRLKVQGEIKGELQGEVIDANTAQGANSENKVGSESVNTPPKKTEVLIEEMD